MARFSAVGNQEIGVIEEYYQSYLQHPETLNESWRNFFEGFELAMKSYDLTDGHKVIDHAGVEKIQKEFKILNLINGYRQRGHLFTRTNPVRRRRQYTPTLEIQNFGLEEKDLDVVFHAGNEIGIGPATLRQIIAHLNQTYCESIGVEYLYMRNPELIDWLKVKMESTRNSEQLAPDVRKHIFYHLNIAAGFENFIHRKFVGQKRFSLEGTEGLIPALDAIIEHGVQFGIEEYVIGISHRGRLNVLANILKKPYEFIFNEFQGTEYEEGIMLGDVKYHLGYDSEVVTDNGSKVKLSLLPNPSHLEAVTPVAEGMVRAKIDHKFAGNFEKIAPILIHGDAAIAGQGIVYEVVQMALLEGYKTGGTIHIVINNQVGFTTDYLDARSSTYCTDVAKITRSPVFHVNGDDAEAIIFTVKLALEFRQHFHSDFFIDILSYRKYGHNEGDEPRFTQPLLYKAIAQHPNPRDIYAKKLIESGLMTQQEVDQEIEAFNNALEEKYEESKKIKKVKIKNFLVEEYKGYRLPKSSEIDKTQTSVSASKLIELANQVNTLPGDKKFFDKIIKLLDNRKQLIEENKVDWALAEQLAFGTLLTEGVPVRLSGQDSQRGTFSHRHAAIVIEDTDVKYFPLNNIAPDQAPFTIYNSPLNEYGVMGFEYGYAMAYPKGLTIWEAQYGDFSNLAQVIIDQYISSAGEKWGLMNGLVLFLPHGYEGQGSEHSSARIERIMLLCANNNLQVMNPTTPANLFHLMRRQALSDIRIPMIVFTPKSMLRNPLVISPIEHLSSQSFKEVIADEIANQGKASMLVFSSGKIYYELLERRQKLVREDVGLVRIEQLYPFPIEEMRRIISENKAKRVIWVQDEPENMGAWPYIAAKFPDLKLELISRRESASPAAGLPEKHKKSLERILNTVFLNNQRMKE
jgi:2-oxoglutarate dehydrogenase E1 component